MHRKQEDHQAEAGIDAESDSIADFTLQPIVRRRFKWEEQNLFCLLELRGKGQKEWEEKDDCDGPGATAHNGCI